MKKKIVLIVTNIPNPYRIPLFNKINKILDENSIELKVCFGSSGYKRRKWKIEMKECEFNYLILKSRKINLGIMEKTFFLYSGLVKLIKNEDPDIVIVGGFSIATMKIWFLSFFRDLKYIIWSGSFLSEKWKYSFLKSYLRRLFIKRAAGFIAYGKKSKEYFLSMGASENKVQIGLNTVNTDFFNKETNRIRKKIKKASAKKVITFVGYLVKRKGVSDILRAVKVLSKKRSDFILEIIGDGKDKNKLDQYVKVNNLEEYVVFFGFKQKNELPKYLARSNCFLFPTRFDIWGLVLNEAMASGIPCISSIYAGATYDLIENEVTGFAIDFTKKNDVVEKINYVLDHPEVANRIGENASNFIRKNATLKKSAEGFINSIMQTIF